MKTGDKVYCIKSLGMSSNYNQFEKGQAYIIKSIFEVANKIYVEYAGRDGGKYSAGFYINNNPEGGIGWQKFSNYFIDLKETRKMKLNKLDEKM